MALCKLRIGVAVGHCFPEGKHPGYDTQQEIHLERRNCKSLISKCRLQDEAVSLLLCYSTPVCMHNIKSRGKLHLVSS